jgi:hypothetical protein
MLVHGGYLKGTQSMRYHPIKNIILKPDNWKSLNLLINGDLITKICNTGSIINFKQILSDDYNIVLTVNGYEYYKNKQVYEYTLDIICENDNDNFIEYSDDMIYDC